MGAMRLWDVRSERSQASELLSAATVVVPVNFAVCGFSDVLRSLRTGLG